MFSLMPEAEQLSIFTINTLKYILMEIIFGGLNELFLSEIKKKVPRHQDNPDTGAGCADVPETGPDLP